MWISIRIKLPPFLQRPCSARGNYSEFLKRMPFGSLQGFFSRAHSPHTALRSPPAVPYPFLPSGVFADARRRSIFSFQIPSCGLVLFVPKTAFCSSESPSHLSHSHGLLFPTQTIDLFASLLVERCLDRFAGKVQCFADARSHSFAC